MVSAADMPNPKSSTRRVAERQMSHRRLLSESRGHRPRRFRHDIFALHQSAGFDLGGGGTRQDLGFRAWRDVIDLAALGFPFAPDGSGPRLHHTAGGCATLQRQASSRCFGDIDGNSTIDFSLTIQNTHR